jgi:hypothetical protein
MSVLENRTSKFELIHTRAIGYHEAQRFGLLSLLPDCLSSRSILLSHGNGDLSTQDRRKHFGCLASAFENRRAKQTIRITHQTTPRHSARQSDLYAGSDRI